MLCAMSGVSPTAIAQLSWSAMLATWINSKTGTIHHLSSRIDPRMISRGSDLKAVEASNISLYVIGYLNLCKRKA